MPVTSMSYSQYKPTQLVIESLGIGLSSNTNDNLNLSDTQHLIVGETLVGDLKNYGLVVDKHGVAINSTIPNRAAYSNEYALFVDGNVYIRGTLTASNIIGAGAGAGAGAGSGDIGFWERAAQAANAIYFPGKITLGNLGTFAVATQSSHAINVIESASCNIDNIQLNINNTLNARLRMGIMGTTETSPAIINTSPGIGLEFHVSCAQSNFEQQSIPNVVIDQDGYVGINTSVVYPRTLEQAQSVSTLSGFVYPVVTERMNLDVNGSIAACNVIIHDYESGSNVNIDRLYVRRTGVTLNPQQVIPGTFAAGNYIFQSNLGVAGSIDPGYALTVNGKANIKDILNVEGPSYLASVDVKDSVMFDVATFCNDIFVHRDAIIRESIRLKGGMFIEVPRGENEMAWCNIQFTVAEPGYSNINIYGAGITTPGRLGVGIVPDYDEVNNQLTVRKRSWSSNIYELELYDLGNSEFMDKAAYIGHPQTGPGFDYDGSLVIATPAAYDREFNKGLSDAPQNIYLYPGDYAHAMGDFIVRSNNPPVINASHTRRVGILTFEPLASLDIRGTMAISGEMYKVEPGTTLLTNGTPRIGMWLERPYAAVTNSWGEYATYRGLEYTNSNAPYVGINTDPDPRFGLIVSGGVKSANGYYTSDDRRMGDWILGTASNTQNLDGSDVARWAPVFTLANVGIGQTAPSAALEVKSSRLGTPTRLRLVREDTTQTTSINLGDISKPWDISANAQTDILSVSFSNQQGMSALYNPLVSKTQFFFGSNTPMQILTSLSNFNPSATVAVDGGLSVIGDVKISGRYYAQGTYMINSNMQPDPPEIKNDDVFISGQRIYVNPQIGAYFGYNQSILPTDPTEYIPLRVYQPFAGSNIVAHFRTSQPTGLVQLRADNKILRFGLLTQNNETDFVFTDGNNNRFLSFNVDQANGQRNIAFNNVRESAKASLHIQNTSAGSNMLKLTRYIDGSDVTPFAPEIELQKVLMTNNVQTEERGWIVRGPVSSYNQKLSFDYFTRVNGDSSRTRNEVMSLSSNGCIGLGVSDPEFAIDIRGEGKRGSIRLYNSGNGPLPQLIFQSGPSNTFGADHLTDYRFYSSNNEFIFDMQNDFDGYKSILHFNEDAHVGINTIPDQQFAVNVGGGINVSDGFYIDGTPLFSERGVNLYATHIYLRPEPQDYGGLVVNLNQATSNLFYIRSGRDENMMTLDSAYDEAQIYFRTKREGVAPAYYDIGRMALSNDAFAWSFRSNAPSDLHIPADGPGYVKSVVFTTDGIQLMQPDAGISFGASGTIASGVVDGLAVSSNISVNGSLTATSNLALGGTFSMQNARITSSNSSNSVFSVSPVNAQVGMVMNSNGHIGIGTTTPKSVLQVGSNVFLSSNICIGTSNSTSALHVVGASTLQGHVLPGTNVVYDLGASNMRWRDVYLSSGSLDIDSTRVSRVSATGALRIHDQSALMPIVAQSIVLDESSNIVIRPSTVDDATDSPIIFSRTGDNNSSLLFEPIVKSPLSIGTGLGTKTPDAVLHVVAASNVTIPSLILDHEGLQNEAIMDIRVSGQNAVSVDRLGSMNIKRDLTVDSLFQTTPSFIVNASTRDSDYTGNEVQRLGNIVLFTPNQSTPNQLYYISKTHSGMGESATVEVLNVGDIAMASPGTSSGIEEIEVTVIVNAGTRKFALNGNITPSIQLYTGRTYRFVQSDPSNTGFPITVGTNSDGSQLTTDVTYVGTPGTTGAYLEVQVTLSTPNTLFYFSLTEPGMGEPATISIRTKFMVTVEDGKFYISGERTPFVKILRGKVYEFDQTDASNGDFPLTFNTVRDGGRFFETKLDATFSNMVSCVENVLIGGDLDVSGNIRNSGNVITTSDARLKTDLERITNSLDRLDAINGYTYMKQGQGQGQSWRRDTGLIAQEVQRILPEAVDINETTGILSIAYGNMMGLVVEAIKELRQEVQELKKRLK